MARYIGFDSPSLVSPADVLRAYARALDAALVAQARYDRFHAELSEDDLADPTPAVEGRLELLQERYERRLVRQGEAERAALATMIGLGVVVNVGGVRLDGKLFALIQDDEASRPSIIVIDLVDVVDLDS